MTTIQDEALEQRVRSVIMQDKRIGGLPIMVRAANGEISLKGKVDHPDQKELAKIVTQGIPGVRQVNTEELAVREETEQ